MNYIGRNLKINRLLRNLSLKEAGDLLNMSPTAVAKYEKGEIYPDSQKLILFANAYNVKTSTLLKSYDSPIMSFSSFRKKKRLCGKNLELLKDVIQDEVSKYLEVLEIANYDKKINFRFKTHKCCNFLDAENAAISFRTYIGISNRQPISDLINIIENLGILVVQIKNINNNFDDFDGLCEIINGIPIIVILDNIKDGARQRFTIAHELGHLLLNINNNEIDEEKLCHRFASAFLMPEEAVINEFGNYRNSISFYELTSFKKEFKVSYAAILYRLKDLCIINEYLYKKLSIFISTNIGKNDLDPISPEKSYHFKKMVHRFESDGIISLNKACELLEEGIDDYNKENYTN